jgi:adenosylhomocysteine nucleosidase
MPWRWMIQNWLRNLAEEKIRATVVEAAREHASAAAGPSAAENPVCDVGLTFALGEESGGLEDRLTGLVTTKGAGFTIRRGDWQGRRVAIALSGAGCNDAAKATEAVILGHRPAWVFSAGFCGGLSAGVKRHDILVADRVADAEGNEIAVDLQRIQASGLLSAEGVHVGRLLTLDSVVRRPRDKRALGRDHDALGVDLESFAVADVCRRRGPAFLAIRVVSDAVDDELPREVERLARHKSRAAQFGAALGAILDRPGALKQMLKLKENSLKSSDRLAKFLIRLIEHLVPAPPPPSPPSASAPS